MGNFFEFFRRAIPRFFQGIQGSYAFNLLGKMFIRLKTAVMNPFRRIVRKVQQIFNVNQISAKLVTPISSKVRKIMSGEAKSPEDYFTIGRFWVSKMLVYVLIMGSCAMVFIYFSWMAPKVSDTITTENLLTTTYYDFDDMKLGEFTGKANIRAANGEVVYTGDIVAGVCTGAGTLWNQSGVLIYKGSFENNCFKGDGTLYYPNGKIQYTGEFLENNFSGQGVLYYPDGSVQYEGMFENGTFSNEGVLYNENGIMVYEGEFQSGTFHGTGISYYNTGIKKYEGEFYMGRAQGKGKSYSPSGKAVFEGQFARDNIHYESLLGCTMKDALKMFQETPIIYYSENNTSFLFENAKTILKTDSQVRIRLNGDTGVGKDSWYLPEGDGETLAELENLEETEKEDSDEENKEDENSDKEMEDLPVNNKYNIYHYLTTDEWQKESELDWGAVNIIGVSTYQSDLDVKFLEEQNMTPENGAPSLQECVAIERIRLNQPTAFSTISYELTIINRTHIKVNGINLAETIYEEVYELDNVRYRLCYPADNPNELMFVTYENN